MRNPLQSLIYLVTFAIITPLTLFVSIFSLITLSADTGRVAEAKTEIFSQRPAANVYAANSSSFGQVAGVATAADARYEILYSYLEKYNSPLLAYTDYLIAASERYNLDFRLLVAIAQQESNLCKKAPEDSHNCWGWGIHSKGTLRFASYPEAIEVVAKGLREEYLDKGYQTPEEIMKKYTPLSNGSWAAGVHQFLAEME